MVHISFKQAFIAVPDEFLKRNNHPLLASLDLFSCCLVPLLDLSSLFFLFLFFYLNIYVILFIYYFIRYRLLDLQVSPLKAALRCAAARSSHSVIAQV